MYEKYVFQKPATLLSRKLCFNCATPQNFHIYDLFKGNWISNFRLFPVLAVHRAFVGTNTKPPSALYSLYNRATVFFKYFYGITLKLFPTL